MLRRAWIVIAWVVSLFAVSQQVVALDIKATNYDIYLGDVNGDGYSDFYFYGKPLIIILHGDIATPIVIFPGNFVLYGTASGYSAAQTFTLDATLLAQKVTAGSVKLAVSNTDYVLWTNGTSTQTNILLRGATASTPSVLLANFAGAMLPIITQTYSPNVNPLANISNKSLLVSAQDLNGDGKKDILVGTYVYLSDISEVQTPFSPVSRVLLPQSSNTII
jgi:hypothetical protein